MKQNSMYCIRIGSPPLQIELVENSDDPLETMQLYFRRYGALLRGWYEVKQAMTYFSIALM